MKNMLTIFRREFWAYFNSPIAYIFIVIFLLLSSVIFMVVFTFFARRQADMRMFFDVVPYLLSVFIPALTMRIWAEERQTGTIALLFALPMRPWELVAGKYLAAIACYFIALIGTAPVPIAIMMLGSPDMGKIFCGYLGLLFLGVFFIAAGVFFSGLFKDQIAALAVGVIVCFFIYALGFQDVESFLNDAVAGAGTFIKHALGGADHYYKVGRGIIEIKDAVFFCSYALIFLILNVITLSRIKQPGRRLVAADKGETAASGASAAGFWFGVVILITVGVMANAVISPMRLGRLDFTEGKIYTVNPESREILGKLDDKVKITYYVSQEERMPGALKDLQRDVTDKLMDLADLSPDFTYDVVVVPDCETKLKELRDKKKIYPFPAIVQNITEMSQLLIWSAIEIDYSDKKRQIIGKVTPDSLADLEYNIVRMIAIMSMDKPPAVILAAPVFDPYPGLRNNPEILEKMRAQGYQTELIDLFKNLQKLFEGDGYEVKRTNLVRGDSIPPGARFVVVTGFEELDDRPRYEIARALHEGATVFLASQRTDYRFEEKQRGFDFRVDIYPEKTKSTDNMLLDSYGVTLGERFLFDIEHVPITFSSSKVLQFGSRGPEPMRIPIDLPCNILIQQGNVEKTPINRQPGLPVFYVWGSPVELNEQKIAKNGLASRIVATTSASAWFLEREREGFPLELNEANRPHQAVGKVPVAVMLEGQFPDVYAGNPRPDWPDENANKPGQEKKEKEPEAPPAPMKPAPGRLIVFGCAKSFLDNFLQLSGPGDTREAPGAYQLVATMADSVTINPALSQIRSKENKLRMFPKVDEDKVALYLLFTIALVPALFIAAGAARFIVRRAKRESYESNLKS
jgi:ABC-type transport system involved in multi-copper enzyme maturation permease subunit